MRFGSGTFGYKWFSSECRFKNSRGLSLTVTLRAGSLQPMDKILRKWHVIG